MKIVVIGGSGLIGKKLVPILRQQGHEAVSASPSSGVNALTGEYEDMIKAGVLDPTKVVRTALTNAGSIAALMLTTEALVAEIPEKKDAPMPGGHGGGGGMEGMY